MSSASLRTLCTIDLPWHTRAGLYRMNDVDPGMRVVRDLFRAKNLTRT
jgi:hypothetical protein